MYSKIYIHGWTSKSQTSLCICNLIITFVFLFQMHEDCVAMETESFIPNKEFNISEGLFVNVVLQKHYKAIILCFLLKLC